MATMKCALFATILGIVGGVAILLAVPAEENTPVVKIHSAKWGAEYGAPLVPQIEEVLVVPEPLEHYSIAQAKTKTEKQSAESLKCLLLFSGEFYSYSNRRLSRRGDLTCLLPK
jgi:hypothetical protein